MKPYFDYPLNTCLLEKTHEFNVNAIAGSGTGQIPSGTYGSVFTIAPHSYQDLDTNF